SSGRSHQNALIDAAPAYPGDSTHRQTLGINLIQARSHDLVVGGNAFLIHHIVKLAEASAVALQHTLHATLLQSAPNAARGISDQQDLRTIRKNSNNLADDSFRRDNAKIRRQAGTAALINEYGVRTFTRTGSNYFRRYYREGKARLEIEQSTQPLGLGGSLGKLLNLRPSGDDFHSESLVLPFRPPQAVQSGPHLRRAVHGCVQRVLERAKRHHRPQLDPPYVVVTADLE